MYPYYIKRRVIVKAHVVHNRPGVWLVYINTFSEHTLDLHACDLSHSPSFLKITPSASAIPQGILEKNAEMPWLKEQLDWDFHIMDYQIIVTSLTILVRFHFILAKFNHWCWTVWPFLDRFPSLSYILNHQVISHHIIHQSTHFLPHLSLWHDAFPRMLCNWCCWHAAKHKESSPELESKWVRFLIR